MNRDILKPLLAWSSDTNFSPYSSYPTLAKYISNSKCINALRKWPKRIHSRTLNRIIRTYAISDWYLLSSIEVERRVWQLVQKEQIDLVHFLWAERDLGYISWVYNHNLPPLICTFHICSDSLPKILRHKNLLRKLSAVIIVSETQRQFFESCGLDSSKIYFIPHGIDTNFFKPPLKKKKDDGFKVLSVGSYRRNFSLMREVFFKLKKQKNISFQVITSKNNFKYFSDLENVELLSNLTEDELLKVYQSASCLLLSVENATANNGLLEGIACGLPIIAENIGGIPEYVNHKCSILTEPGKSEPIVQSILNLSTNIFICNTMSNYSRELALQFSWDKIACKTEKIYKELCL